MTQVVVIVQHGEKSAVAGDPGLTDLGARQSVRAASALASLKPVALVTSPLLRARQTALPLEEATSLVAVVDARLRERMNLEVDVDPQQFLADWARSTRDRTWHPPFGRSSAQTAADMLAAIDEHARTGGPIVLFGHGGATIDLLRDLIGDDDLERRRPGIIERGMPTRGITRLERERAGAWRVRMIGDLTGDHPPRIEDVF